MVIKKGTNFVPLFYIELFLRNLKCDLLFLSVFYFLAILHRGNPFATISYGSYSLSGSAISRVIFGYHIRYRAIDINDERNDDCIVASHRSSILHWNIRAETSV